MTCIGCGASLTDEERTYYGSRCEQCERKIWRRVRAWRAGREDPELDAFYSATPDTIH